MSKLVEGMKVRYLPQPEWGVGHLLKLEEGSAKACIIFPGREGGPVWVSAKAGALVAHPLKAGDRVRTVKGESAAVVGEVEGGRGLRRYVLEFENGEQNEWPESEVRVVPPEPDALSMLAEVRVGDARNFLLRRRALKLDDQRRCDALGALLASRVMVKPYQVGVVQRVLSARRPRFILADEVGLGKTIEAGMVFSALRLSGLASRVLVVAPSHLTVQWLIELAHKFNQLFTFLDTDRYAQALQEQPKTSPWARFPKIVASLEMLSRNEEHRRQAAAPEAWWDLVIIDEAHHLKGEKAFELARALAANSWGLLLLTATPMQLDPAEYHQLLTLIDPQTAPTLDGLLARLRRQEEVSAAVRELLNGRGAAEAVAKLSAQFPADKALKKLTDPDALLSHLAETYSLSDQLIRNRRVVVGSFAGRRLHRHRVTLPEDERAARNAALARLGSDSQVRGAALSGLLRRLESSTAAFLEAARSSRALAPVIDSVKLPIRDAKFLGVLEVLRGIWAAEPTAKVLVFTESRATLEMLRDEWRKESIEALIYHGDLPLIERDRQVARFRDPEGPRILICTEVGGEGRNFQFAHHLVNYDLPWSPAMMEQRIGRLDRIGQTRTVDIHVFDLEGTFSADVLSVLADAVGVFEETVGGLDAVLEEVEPRLTELAVLSPQERAEYARSLKSRVEEARSSIRRAYDPLLDLRSFDQLEVKALVRRGYGRIGIEEEGEEEGTSIEDGLWTIARDLDERLEETVTELARKVGIGVDTDEQVEAFQCAFHLGRELTVEALPGLELGEDKVILGTFWRDTAVEHEEIDYFATGHPLVEALFGFLRDGPYGRNGVRYIEVRGPTKARGLEFLFHLIPPDPEDTSPGARVPSRQLSRFVDSWLIHLAVVRDANGAPKVNPSVLPVLENEGRPLRGDEVRAAFPGFETFVSPAAKLATQAAREEMKRVAERARDAIQAERDQTLARLKLSLRHQGLAPEAVEAEAARERSHYASLLKTLDGLSVSLDSVAGFVVNR